MNTLKEIAAYLVDRGDVSIRYSPEAFISLNDLDIFISYHVVSGEVCILNGYDRQLSWDEFVSFLDGAL